MLKRIIGHKLTRGFALSIIDQGICSISSFLTGIFVARAVSPYEFGEYSLLFAGIMILLGLQNALLTGPIRVLGVDKEGVCNNAYFKSQVQLQILIGGSLMLASILFLPFLSTVRIQSILAFSACLFFFQLQELVRIINLTRLSLTSLLVTDVLNHGLRIGLLATLFQLGLLTSTTALLVIAFASAVGVVFFIRDGAVRSPPQTVLRDTLARNWSYGKWVFLEGIAYTTSTQLYLYFTAIWVDKQSAGALNATQNLLNVVNVLILGVMGFAIPTARRKLIEFGYAAWRRWLMQVGILLVIATIVIVSTVALFAKPLLSLVYTPYFGEYAFLMPILAISYSLAAFNTVFAAAFKTARQPQVGFIAKAASALLTIGLSYPMLQNWGVKGAAIGLAATQALWAFVYLIYIAKGKLEPGIVENSV